MMQVDTNVGRICARLGWLPLDADKALEVGTHPSSTKGPMNNTKLFNVMYNLIVA